MKQLSLFLNSTFLILCTFIFNSRTLAQAPPNLIVFIADDVSWNDFSCYGNPDVQTPNIDRLASNGIRFNNVYLTASSCSPSRNSIMTGRYPHNTGAAELHSTPPDDMVSFAEVLHKSGYYCAQGGKWHMGDYALRGFDKVYVNGTDVGHGGEKSWTRSIGERPMNKPFFMWFAAYDAHRTWDDPLYTDGAYPDGEMDIPPYMADGNQTKADLMNYYHEIERFDHYIGEVVTLLEEQDAIDNTVIIVMADNGRPFPRSKTRVYDSGMKTPFIVSWPAGITKESILSNSLISSIDIAPTLLDLANIRTPDSFQGKSFKNLLQHPNEEFRTYLFAEHNWHDYESHERMVRTMDYMYIVNSRAMLPNQGPADVVRGPAFLELMEIRDHGKLTAAQSDIFINNRPYEELFNCRKDPMQLVNLASVPEYNDIMENMRMVLKRWIEETGDNVPEKLTADWFDRDSGLRLEEMNGIRGEMPGSKTNATRNNNKGPF